MDLSYRVINDYPKAGIKFIDFTTSLQNPQSFQFIIEQLTLKVKEGYYDCIVAPEARGFIWGATLAYTTGLPLILIRKKGKLPKVGASIDYPTEYSFDTLEIPDVDLTNKTAVFVNDVFATGGTYEACKKLVADCGGELVKAVVLYDLGLKETDEVQSIMKGAIYD